MNTLSAVFLPETPQPVQVKKKQSADIWAAFWEKVFSKRPDIQKRLLSKPLKFFIDILYNPNYSEVQKLEKIFGISAAELKQAGLSGLGDIWSDISNFFREGNLRNIEIGIRQGQQISSNIANAINALRNQGSQQNAEELTTSKDIQSQFYFGADSFYQKYGPLLVVAGGALLLILILKK